MKPMRAYLVYAVECLLVLVLAGILLVRSRGDSATRAREVAARMQVEFLCKACESFKADNGVYPSGKNALESLVQPFAGATNWHGPYLTAENGMPNDPWGTPYRYEIPGHHGTNAFDIISAGPDRKSGTEDDIGNWPAR